MASYLKQKGENLATHEDIAKLVDQVKAVTSATKQIEAAISNDVWDRQKRWEIKREILFEATRRTAAAQAALSALYSTFLAERQNRESNDSTWLEQKHTALSRWTTAQTQLEETRLLVEIGCGKETQQAFDNLTLVAGVIANGTLNVESIALEDLHHQSRSTLLSALDAIRAAIRKELEIDRDARTVPNLISPTTAT